MRIGVGLLVVLVVGLALAAMLRPTPGSAPPPSARDAAAQPEGPLLRGASRAPGAEDDAEGAASPPTENEVRARIATILAGLAGWEDLLRWLDDSRIDFGPHLGAILAACRGDDKGLRRRATLVLDIAFAEGRIAARRDDFKIDGLDPEEAHPLGPEHFADVASLLRAEVKISAPWPVCTVLYQWARLGPLAHEMVPDTIAWYWRAWAALEKTRNGRTLWRGLVQGSFLRSRSVIGQLGPSALPHLAVVASDEPDDEEFELLFYAVDTMHEDATPTLVAWLDDDNPSLRRTAARVIARSQQHWSEELRAALEARLRDPDEKVRKDVAAALATLLPGTADVISRILAGEDHVARAGALTRISTWLNQTTPELRTQLFDMMRTPDYRISGPILDVAMALSEQASRPTLEARAPGLLHAMVDAGTGLYAADSVYEEDDRRERLWQSMGPDAWPHLWKGLHSEDPGLPLGAAWAMAWNGAPDPVHRGLLEHWLASHPTSALRIPIAAALGDAANTAVIETLLGGLRSDDPCVVSVAALGFQRIGLDIARYLPALAGAVQTVHEIRFCYGKPTHSIERLDATLRLAARADLDAAIDLVDHDAARVRAVVHVAFAADATQGLAVLHRHWGTASSHRRVGILEALLAPVFATKVELPALRAATLACFKTKDRALRVAAARVIYHYRDPESLVEEAATVLASTVLEADDDRGAAGALATLAREASRGRHAVALRALQPYVEHEDEDVRRRAGWWIDEIENPR